jgi:hypothetical protein
VTEPDFDFQGTPSAQAAAKEEKPKTPKTPKEIVRAARDIRAALAESNAASDAPPPLDEESEGGHAARAQPPDAYPANLAAKAQADRNENHRKRMVASLAREAFVRRGGNPSALITDAEKFVKALTANGMIAAYDDRY